MTSRSPVPTRSLRPAAAGPGPAGTPGPGADDAGMRVALTSATRVSVTAVLAVLAVQLLVPALWSTAPWVPFLVGLLLGVPHGAVDHLVPWWTSARSRSAPVLLALLVGYVALAAVAFLAARAWPVPALLGFLLASIAHFGAGETAVQALRHPHAHPATRSRRTSDVVVAAAFGVTTVLVPLAAHPEQAEPVLIALAPGVAPLFVPGWQPWALAAVAVLDAVAVLHRLRQHRPGDAAELVLLAVLFLAVPPLPAFAVYFGAWHGLRHLLRLAATDPANAADLARGRVLRPLARLARHAALPTLTVVAGLAAVWTVPGLLPRIGDDVVAAGLAIVFALTVPHLVVVALLDRRQLRRPGPLRHP